MLLVILTTAQAPIPETESARENDVLVDICVSAETDTAPVMAKQLWDYLMVQYENEYAAAAILANADFEAGLCPYRTEGDRQKTEDGMYPFSLEYTKKVDSGEINRWKFSHNGPNGGGYGLFEWTAAGRKEGLYDFSSRRGTSIGDWKMQLDYAYEEIVQRYYRLYCELLTADNVEEATEAFAMQFEQASNTQYSLIIRKSFAKSFYGKYASGDPDTGYEKGTLLPVNHSYDYMRQTFCKDPYNPSLYIYMAEIALHEKGYLNTIGTAGYYGEELADAIRRFQRAHNLEEDGILDSEVWDLLAS